MRAEAFVGDAHHLPRDTILFDVPHVEACGGVFVADHGVAVVAQGGDAAEVVRGDAPMR